MTPRALAFVPNVERHISPPPPPRSMLPTLPSSPSSKHHHTTSMSQETHASDMSKHGAKGCNSPSTPVASDSDCIDQVMTSDDENADGGIRLHLSDQEHSDRRKKKTRTVFSRSQVFQLEQTFDSKRYLSSSERLSLATSLNLSETQIKIWFQNRRNKWKRQLTTDLETVNLAHARTMMHVPIMYHGPHTACIQNTGLEARNAHDLRDSLFLTQGYSQVQHLRTSLSGNV